MTHHQEDWNRYSSENLVLHQDIISQLMISFISMPCRFDSASFPGGGGGASISKGRRCLSYPLGLKKRSGSGSVCGTFKGIDPARDIKLF